MTKRIRRNYTKEYLEPIVARNTNIADILRDIGINPKGKSYSTIRNKINEFDIDDRHLAKITTKTISKHDINSLQDGINLSSKIIHRLLDDLGFIKKCAECNIGSTWNDKPLKLQIDHINGNSSDNRVENLRYLCPNCHSQTDTYGSSNPHTYQKKNKKD